MRATEKFSSRVVVSAAKEIYSKNPNLRILGVYAYQKWVIIIHMHPDVCGVIKGVHAYHSPYIRR